MIEDRDADLLQLLSVDRRIAYALVDTDLTIRSVGGAVEVLCGGEGGSACRGGRLTDIAPEFCGGEAALDDVCQGRLSRFELSLINREREEGGIQYVTLVVLPTMGPDGEIVGLTLVAQDVTETGLIEQQLTQNRNELQLAQSALAAANLELRHASEMKSRFVSVAAHELRSPLTTIAGYLEMLLDGDFGELAPAQRSALEALGESSGRLMGITSELLDVARIEAGRVQLSLVPTEVAGLVVQAAAEFRPQVEAKAQTLTLSLMPDPPPGLCDPARTSQILTNLVSNAVKYTPEHGHIKIRLEPDGDPGYLQLAVLDNGVGIAPREQERLFSRFYRAESAWRTGASGAGLGLYVAHELAELQGGRIWLESQIDRGTAIYLTIPIA